uniref:Uncharacterized protein n=1 Tax=Setaria italica TaxID=4555 RepID=K3XU26_SETIT
MLACSRFLPRTRQPYPRTKVNPELHPSTCCRSTGRTTRRGGRRRRHERKRMPSPPAGSDPSPPLTAAGLYIPALAVIYRQPSHCDLAARRR